MKNSCSARDPFQPRTPIDHHDDIKCPLDQPPPDVSISTIEYLNAEEVKQQGRCLKMKDEGNAAFNIDERQAFEASSVSTCYEPATLQEMKMPINIGRSAFPE